MFESDGGGFTFGRTEVLSQDEDADLVERRQFERREHVLLWGVDEARELLSLTVDELAERTKVRLGQLVGHRHSPRFGQVHFHRRLPRKQEFPEAARRK
jgi:hypothetical protein